MDGDKQYICDECEGQNPADYIISYQADNEEVRSISVCWYHFGTFDDGMILGITDL